MRGGNPLVFSPKEHILYHPRNMRTLEQPTTKTPNPLSNRPTMAATRNRSNDSTTATDVAAVEHEALRACAKEDSSWQMLWVYSIVVFAH